jgi:TolB-like protein
VLERTQAWKDSAAKAQERQIRKEGQESVVRAILPQNLQKDLDALMGQLLKEAGLNSAARVAVLPFEIGSERAAQAARMASEYAVVYLAGKGTVQVVERAQFQKVASEIALSQTGAMAEEQLLRVGTLLSATHLVVGMVDDEGDDRRVTVRIVVSETGQVIAAAATVVGERQLNELVQAALGERLNPSSAAFRSLAVPGWGQFYTNHPGHGTISMIGVLGAAGVLVWSVLDYREKDDVVTMYKDGDRNTVTPGQTAEEWAVEANAAVADKNDAATRTNALIGVLAGVWVLNAIDGLVCGAIESRSTKNQYFAVAPLWGRGAEGTACGVALHMPVRTGLRGGR